MTDPVAETNPVSPLDSPSSLVLNQKVVDGVLVVHARGEVDMATVHLLDEQLRAAEAVVVPPARLVLDLTGVTFLASMGLAQLATHHELCAERGTVLRIVASDRLVLRPIQLTGLDEILVIVDTLDDALAS